MPTHNKINLVLSGAVIGAGLVGIATSGYSLISIACLIAGVAGIVIAQHKEDDTDGKG